MLRIRRLVTLLFAFSVIGSLLAAGELNSHDASLTATQPEHDRLQADPNVRWGRLDNGLRYAILPHSTPPQRVSVCLFVLAGSYQEQDDELGFAHFVEHMAFRDTRDFPGDLAIRTLQAMGLSFGPHVNAQTGYFRTHYTFGNIPADKPEAVVTGLKILRSMADGILFLPEGVESERGVIFGERRLRSGSFARFWGEELEFLPPRNENLRQQEIATAFNHTRLSSHYPIGTTRTLQAARAKKLRAFYDRWYRPDRMVVTVVGDIATDQAEKLVREIFAPVAARGPAPKDIPVENAPAPAKDKTPVVAVESVPGLPSVEVSFGCASERMEPDSPSRRANQLARSLALYLVAGRLNRVSEQADAPFIAVSSALIHSVPGHEVAMLRATCLPSLWSKTMSALDNELRRASRDGFSEVEFQRAVKQKSVLASEAEHRFASENSLNLARSLAYSIGENVVFTPAAAEESLAKKQLASLTAEQCRDALRTLFPPEKTFVCLFGGFGDVEPAVSLVRSQLAESRGVEPGQYADLAAAKSFPYTDFGPPGVVLKREHDTVLDADFVQFENGVRLTLKRTDLEPGKVHFTIRFGGGRLACPPDKPGLDSRVIAWAVGGLRDMSPEDERAALADLGGWSSNVSSSAETFSWVGSGPSAQFPRVLQAALAHFVYPAFRDADWSRSFEYARRQLAPTETTAGGAARRVMTERMTGHHPALSYPMLEDISLRTLAEFKEWFPSQLTAASMEIAIVGDVDREKAIDAIARTFATLPKAAAGDPYFERRRVAFPPKPFAETVSFDGRNASASVVLAWPVPEAKSFVERLRGVVLASALDDRLRLKLRSEMGEAYAPSANFMWNTAFAPSPTYLVCVVDCAPTHAERVATVVRALVKKMGEDGLTREEFERARSPHLRSAESRLRSNRSWLTALSTAQSEYDESVSWVHAPEEYQTMTQSEVNRLARIVFSESRECQLLVVPVSKEAEALNARGLKAYSRRDYNEAVRLFSRAIAKDSTYANAYYNRGRSKQALGDQKGARGDYDHALSLTPGEPKAYLQRGIIKRMEGDWSGSLSDFDRWIGLNSVDAAGYFERGITKHAKGDFADALQDFDRAISLNPKVSDYFEWRSVAKEASGDHAGAAADEARSKALESKTDVGDRR